MTLSYLVSTAGHAQRQNERYPHHIQSILQLVDEGAEELGDEPVVGFTRQDSAQWRCDYYSYRQLLALSADLEAALVSAGLADLVGKPQRTVSILCPTGLQFLISWLALMRMGYAVVFVAPQCSPSAVSSLRQASESTHIIYHPKYASLAAQAAALSTSDNASDTLLPLPALADAPAAYDTFAARVKRPYAPDSLSHVFHTSGTSGNPKPIPYTHRSSVTPLPRRLVPSYIQADVGIDGEADADRGAPAESAAFTTTPIFHGGVSDLLRAWMARSVVCFYPTSDVPITAGNVVAAVEACGVPDRLREARDLGEDEQEERRDRYTVTAFLSVPYILTVLADDEAGMGLMKRMQLVSTGGAPLDPGVGGTMVKAGVRLVSRLGSSECGFLLSSFRDFPTDDGWDWLHNDSPYASALRFEPVPEDKDGRCEMVVTDQWKSKNKSNREDGSYATGDLYIPHQTRRNVWKYVGRGDEVIVMNNGEKASPAPIETILRSHPSVTDALVVGPNRDELGAILFLRPSCSLTPADLSELLEAANASSPSFAQVSKDMCLILPSGSEISKEQEGDTGKALPKSSKGTVQRAMAYEVFKDEIDRLYSGAGRAADADPHSGPQKRSLQEVERDIRSAILAVAPPRDGETLETDADLFNWGVNSLMATRLQGIIQKGFDLGGNRLPSNVVFEHPTIELLSQFLFGLQEGKSQKVQDVREAMRDMAAKYSSIPAPAKQTILLTGATGSLGAFLLYLLLDRPDIERVICLVRAQDDADALERLIHAQTARELEKGTNQASRLQAYAADLAARYLGLKAEVYLDISSSVTCVIHAAWPVHFASSLASFEDSVRGTRNLLDLTRCSLPPARFLFCSSLASVLAAPPADGTIRETFSSDPATASGIGYSQSKWVTEAVCSAAARIGGLQGRIGILRVGQLCGDTRTGWWNEKEGWPLLIRTADRVGCLPELSERPTWLPVDQAAQTIIDIALQPEALKEVYHVVHPHETAWDFILDALHKADLQFKRVSPGEWLAAVERSYEEREADGGSAMLGMWKKAYGGTSPAETETPKIDTANARGASPTLDQLPPLDEAHIAGMVRAWRKTGFLRS